MRDKRETANPKQVGERERKRVRERERKREGGTHGRKGGSDSEGGRERERERERNCPRERDEREREREREREGVNSSNQRPLTNIYLQREAERASEPERTCESHRESTRARSRAR